MRKTRVLPFICLMMIAIVLFSGCTSRDAGEQQIDLNYRAKDPTVLALSLPTDIDSMDPVKISSSWEFEIANAIYEGLVKYNAETGSILPGLAAKWEVSSDGKRYIFTIRENAVFHSEKKVTANDFKFSWERAIKLGGTNVLRAFNNIQGAEAYSKGQALEVSGIKAVDNKTLQVDLIKADQAFLLKMTDPAASVLDQEVITSITGEYGKPSADQPVVIVGAGPFSLVEWAPAQSIVLEDFSRYYQKSKIERIEFQIEPEADIALAEFARGNVDILQSQEPLPDLLLNRDAEFEKLSHKASRAEIVYLGFNTLKPPFNDPALRQAISSSLNKASYVQQIGNYLPAQGLIPRMLIGDAKPLQTYSYDLEAAKRLIGYSQDTDKLKDLSLHYVNIGINKQLAELIKNDLKQIGLEVRPQPLASYEELEYGLKAGTIRFYMNRWIARNPNPEDLLSRMFLSSSTGNVTGYNNEAVDEHLNFAESQNLYSRERVQAILQAERIIMLDAPVITILEPLNYFIINDNLATESLFDPLKVLRLDNIAFKNTRENTQKK